MNIEKFHSIILCLRDNGFTEVSTILFADSERDAACIQFISEANDDKDQREVINMEIK